MRHARSPRGLAALVEQLVLAPSLFLLLVLCGCKSSECSPGEPGCACTSTGECEAGATCTAGICAGSSEVSVRVDAPEARACEILVIDGDARVAGAIFDGGTVGTHVREAPRTAVTFAAGADAAFGATDIRLVVIGTGAEPVRVTSSTCFDAAGAPLSEAAITVGG